MIKDVQQFYADQMEFHGFGRKTFRLETDTTGKVVVHRVKGKFNSLHYIGNQDFRALGHKVEPEINKRFDSSKNIYVSIVNIEWSRGGGIAFPNSTGGVAVFATGYDNRFLTAHEIGHLFGLQHDFRTNDQVMAFTGWKPSLKMSHCAAELLDVRPYFNAEQGRSKRPDAPTTIQMFPGTASPPNAIRLRFEVTDADGLHQAQLLTPSDGFFDDFNAALTDCKRLNGESRTTIEFVTTELMNSYPDSFVGLHVIDINGNITYKHFDIEIASLLPANKVVSIPDAKLAAVVRSALGLSPRDDITQADMWRLKELWAIEREIKSLTGIEQAKGLRRLNLDKNQISDLTPLTGLTSLVSLYFYDNKISDLTPLTGLTNLNVLVLSKNSISDLTPLTGLTNLGGLFLSDNSEISDLTPLTKLTNLTNLYLRGLQIEDLMPVEGLVNLKSLLLEGTPIKDRKPLLALLRKNPDVEIYLKHGGEPLPVTLSSFRAERTDAGVILKWTTESEVDNAGFYLLRGETKSSEFKVINPTLIQGAGTTSERHTYTWIDTTAKPNTAYYYRIEDVSHSGVRKQGATVRMRGFISASGKLTTRWGDLKLQK